MSRYAMNDETGPLRRRLLTEAKQYGMSMDDLTVLANQNDPFRVDTPARHRDGRWLRDTAAELGVLRQTEIHLRGLHYSLLGQPHHDGTPYTNDDPTWQWLVSNAAKAARWLGYIEFDQIKDERNAAPTLHLADKRDPRPYINLDVEISLPDPDDLEPRVGVSGFTALQPYKVVMFGEKASLGPILKPLAKRYGCDLYLPTGEISDTYLHQIAKLGAEDGRPLAVLTFTDSDPAGWQMAVSIARKLQGFQTIKFPDLEFGVYPVGLLPSQVREYDLPSTPLKDTEKRGDEWKAATGTEQTEIDALASLRPDLLESLARRAIERFHDPTLDERVAEAYDAWLEEAQEVLDANADQAELDRLRLEAESRLDEIRAEVERLGNALHLAVPDVPLPAPEVPEPEVDESSLPTPLIDSRDPFVQQCQRLIEHKSYRTATEVEGAA